MSAQHQQAGTQIIGLENLPEKWLCLLFSKLTIKDLKSLKLVNSSFECKVTSLDGRMQNCTISVYNGKDGHKVKSLLDVLRKAKLKPHNEDIKIKFWFNNSISSKDKKLILTQCSNLQVVGLNTYIIEDDNALQYVSTPHLTSLQIRMDKSKRDIVGENVALLIKANSGTLESLSFFSINRASVQIETPLPKVTYLQFYRCSAGFIFDMLFQLKDTVTSVKIETCYRLTDLLPAINTFVIPNLQHLFLEECDSVVLDMMLPSMCSLKSLVFRECEVDCTQIPDLPNLMTLWVDKVDHFGNKILVKCCKTIECLLVEKSNWRLMPKKIKCPKLKHLIFAFQYDPDSDFILKHKSTLETLMVSFGYDFAAKECIEKCSALKTLANLTPDYDNDMDQLGRNDITISKQDIVNVLLPLANSSVIDKFEISSWIIEDNEDDVSDEVSGSDDFSDDTDATGDEDDSNEFEDEVSDDGGVNDCPTS